MAPTGPTLIRPSTEADIAAIAEIYRFHVLNGTGSFEIEAPSAAQMLLRRTDVTASGLPWLVAERSGSVVGYAYANHFRPRPAYRFCLEDSVYVAPQAHGLGLGRALLAELLARCEALGARQMLAVIGDSGNAGSIALHRALGFEPAGQIHAAGWKFEKWLDVVLLQKALGLGSTRAPTPR
ncbi:MAG: N-acetyltransferase family protein [Burkholderiaceae bacterium]